MTGHQIIADFTLIEDLSRLGDVVMFSEELKHDGARRSRFVINRSVTMATHR